MPLQNASGVILTYAAESNYGVSALAGGSSQRLRYNPGSGLNISKDAFASNEVRPDQQVSDFRHGGRRGDGSIVGELSTVTWDDFLASSMRSTWVVGVSVTQVAHTSIALTGNVFTVGTGSLITAGFKIGDVVRLTNLPGAPGTQFNGRNMRITALTATTFTVAAIPTGGANFTAQTAFTLAVVGRKLLNGVARSSYTIEQNFPSTDVSELYTGCRIGGCSISLPPNGIAQASFQIMAQDGQVLPAASAPYFSAPTAAPTTSTLTGIEGGVRLAGVEQAIVTQLDLNISLNLSQTPVIGSPVSPDIFEGRTVVTGSLTYYLNDETLLNVFRQETEVDLVAVCLAANGLDFISFNMQRVKLNGANKQLSGDGGILIQSPFQALLAGSTTQDATTLAIQRSN